MSAKDKKDEAVDTEVVEEVIEETPEHEVVEKVAKEKTEMHIEKNPEVLSLLEKARKEEKKKLYNTIEKLKESVADAGNVREDLESQLADIKDKLDNKTNDSLTEQEVLRKEFKKEAQKNAKTVDKLTLALEDLKADARRKELELYRVQKLQEVGDEVIPSMVRGTTEDEIDDSVEAAKAEYLKIKDKVMSDEVGRKKAIKTTAPSATTPPVSTDEPIVPNMDGMTDAKYLEERDGIMDKLKNKFAEVTGN